MEKQIENEKMILSACMFEYEVLEHTLISLDVVNFYYLPHQSIYSVIKELASKSISITKNVLVTELRLKGETEAIACLMDFYNERLDLDFLNEKIEEVKVFCLRKDLRERCVKGVKFFDDTSKGREDFIKWSDDFSQSVMIRDGKSFRTISDILTKYEENPDKSFIQVLQETQERAQKGEIVNPGYKTCYKDIDCIFGGFKAGHLTIIGARPGVGKTTFALNLALKQLMENDIAVGFFSLEMTGEEITKNMLFCRAEMESREFEQGRITGDDFQRVFKAGKEIQKKIFVIDDTGRLNLSLMESKAKYWQRTFGIKILFIDYLQLITAGGKYNSKYEEVTAISQRLKIIAKELSLPVVCLAQLNRKSAESDQPRVHDLRDSGSIEQDADEIFLLHSPSDGPSPEDKYNKPGILQVRLAKNRHGSTGECELSFIKKLGKIENLTKKECPFEPFNNRKF